jgi:hypothetical protein
MGEVYRARDTRLDRNVAIKVLPSEFSANVDRKQRFEREARAISSLNHPNICALYDVGSQDGLEFLVLEYVEGETLEKRLQSGPLPTEMLLRHGLEIADALEKAHRTGVIHRDLKPANIMLTKSGAKLLDFGLAKWDAAGASEEETLRTLTTAGAKLTEEGTILGTFQYMAPEQLEGREADARTDLFAFGEVLYEMATGRCAFAGKTKASLIAAILSAEPAPISTLQPMTPPALDRLVRGCLVKDPEERWQTAHDVKLQLRAIAEGGSLSGLPAPVAARRKTRERAAWAAAGLLGIFAVAMAIGYIARTPAPAAVIVSQIVAPENGQFVFYGVYGGAPALSPDGKRMVFTGQGKDGRVLLWMRSLNAATAQPLAGTEQGVFPFWSPDSRYVGYFANSKLNRIEASGGPPFPLCDAGPGRGGTWSRDGTILFSPDTLNAPLFRVAASGGVAVPVTKLNPAQNEIAHRWPQFLPDGKHFLFFDFTTTGTIDGTYIGSLDGAAPKLLLRGNVSAIYAPQGYLLYMQQDTLMAQKFDPATLQLTGDAVPLAEQVSSNRALRQATVSVSGNGLLVYGRGHGTSINQLQWLDRSGKEIAQTGEAGDYGGPRISPDGKNLVVSLRVAGDTGQSIWVYDLARGNGTRRTFERMSSISPSWSRHWIRGVAPLPKSSRWNRGHHSADCGGRFRGKLSVLVARRSLSPVQPRRRTGQIHVWHLGATRIRRSQGLQGARGFDFP